MSITLTHVMTLLLLTSFISQSWSAPKGSFQRRNWTPQAMLYLKGTQGRRFISEDRKEGDVYDTLHLETRSQNTEKLSVDQAAMVLLNFLQQAREGGEHHTHPITVLGPELRVHSHTFSVFIYIWLDDVALKPKVLSILPGIYVNRSSLPSCL
uniref:Spexin hormone n=1 Tax=Kryptolebias marmoratus TaxID=37003 RepID=A0A3Q3AG14_KRYMA